MKVCIETDIFVSIKIKELDSPYCEIILDIMDENQIQAVFSSENYL